MYGTRLLETDQSLSSGFASFSFFLLQIQVVKNVFPLPSCYGNMLNALWGISLPLASPSEGGEPRSLNSLF
jgi:hypothetical protein